MKSTGNIQAGTGRWQDPDKYQFNQQQWFFRPSGRRTWHRWNLRFRWRPRQLGAFYRVLIIFVRLAPLPGFQRWLFRPVWGLQDLRLLGPFAGLRVPVKSIQLISGNDMKPSVLCRIWSDSENLLHDSYAFRPGRFILQPCQGKLVFLKRN